MKTFLIGIMLLFCILVSPVFAQEGGNESGAKIDMDKISNILVVFLVLSVVFEVALTPIFNWRIFLSYGHKRGYKTPITVVLAFFVFWSYDLNIVTDLLNVLRPRFQYRDPKSFVSHSFTRS